ncbi:MAG: hypothetical protein P4L90_13955, partial [Rhodopila sp.]|nr:hypothetical protein [Rhodopila sp.]
AAKAKLRFVHEVGAENRDVLLETRQDGLADAECLDGFFVGAGEQMLIVRRGQAEDIAKNMGKSEMHGGDPFHLLPA